jgi:hypothetical protein
MAWSDIWPFWAMLFGVALSVFGLATVIVT